LGHQPTVTAPPVTGPELTLTARPRALTGTEGPRADEHTLFDRGYLSVDPKFG